MSYVLEPASLWTDYESVCTITTLGDDPLVAAHAYLDFPVPFLTKHAKTVLHNRNAYVVLTKTGKIAGMAGYTILPDVYSPCAEAWLWLGRPYWGARGEHNEPLAATAFKALFQQIWNNEPDVTRIEGPVFSNNTRSRALLDSMWIELEYVRRRCLRDRKGILQDVCMYVVFDNDGSFGRPELRPPPRRMADGEIPF